MHSFIRRWAMVLSCLLLVGAVGAADVRFAVGQKAPLEALSAIGTEPAEATVLHFVSTTSPLSESSLKVIEDFVWQPNKDFELRVVAVVVGASPAEANALRDRLHLTFPVMADPERVLFSMVAETGVPRTVIMDAGGEVVYTNAGYRMGREAEYRAVVDSLLNQVPLPLEAIRRMVPQGGSGPVGDVASLVGEPFPELEVEEWLVPLPEDISGKFILVDFWATWCGPCIMSMRQGEAMLDVWKDKMITVALTDEPSVIVAPVLAREKWTQPIAIDTQSRLAMALRIRYIPYAYLKNPEGKVVWQGDPRELWARNGTKLKELLGITP